MKKLRVVVVEGPRVPRPAPASGFAVHRTDYAGALNACAAWRPELLVVHAATPDATEPLQCVRQIRRVHPHLPVALIVAESSEDLAIAALNAGVTRYVREAAFEDAIASLVDELVDSRVPPREDAVPAVELCGGDRLIGQSAAMLMLRAYVKKIAKSTSNVLITGETGTGKELVAQLIHQNSDRSLKPFVSLNCTAIPESLFESELFGHERGAFTGAHAPQPGKLAAADSGTAFFDEIGEIGLPLQAKLLRALEEKRVYRLGAARPVPVDIRVLAATNRDVETAVHDGRFRSDLYYRLNVVRVQLPPLRERLEDIPGLLTHYVSSFNDTFGTSVAGFTAGALETLLTHTWPGNIRELKNVVEAVFVNLSDKADGLVELPDEVRQMLARLRGAPPGERERLVSALVVTNWNKSSAARRLSWSRMTLYRKMLRYHVSESGPAGLRRTLTSASRPLTAARAAKPR